MLWYESANTPSHEMGAVFKGAIEAKLSWNWDGLQTANCRAVVFPTS
jgi:hypothetical protein